MQGPTSSASLSSLVSIKEGIQRVLGGTPPPPYEVKLGKFLIILAHDNLLHSMLKERKLGLVQYSSTRFEVFTNKDELSIKDKETHEKKTNNIQNNRHTQS